MPQSRSEDSPPSPPAAGRQVLVGISGGIAAYKAPELVRRLREGGAEVRVVMTRGAQAFITPLTLQAVSGHRVHTDLLDPEAEAAMGHIELARWADEVIIAPATADLIARLAAGRADDLLTTCVLATEARIWLAPAMNRVMWQHPAVQANLEILTGRGVEMLGPDSGSQACGEEGLGRMLVPDEIAGRILGTPGILQGKHFVVTAGPTREALDPVRFFGNRSSGRMGFAVAAALAAAGARVTLVAGPVSLPTPAGVKRVDVVSAVEMRDAVFAALPADGFVGVAAVADYRPEKVSERKLHKDADHLEVRLVRNPDILAEVAARDPRPFTVGFAAETEEVEAGARRKLEGKHLDLIAANRVGPDAGFESADNALHVYAADGDRDLGSGTKIELARQLVTIIAERMQQGEPSP